MNDKNDIRKKHIRAGYDVPEEKALWLYTKAHILGLQLQ